MLTSDVCIGYPCFLHLVETPYILACDASSRAFGVTLYQKQNGVERPIFFSTKATSKYEAKYSATNLELACLVWVLTIHDSLLRIAPFRIRVDNVA